MKHAVLHLTKVYRLFLVFCLLPLSYQIKAQLNSCTPETPYHYVDLTGQPTGSWISPNHSRVGQCCGAQQPDVCTSFEVLLDSQAVALSFDIYSGSIPQGSMYYQIGCGPVTAVGEQICLSGPGPHRITFCKPGNNTNEYIIQSIAQPIFPPDDTTRAGCSTTLEVMGLIESSLSWHSVYPGTEGDYNHLLNCIESCSSTVFTPDANTPAFIDYVVCGFPVADKCGFTLEVCDTFRVHIMDSLITTVTPNPASFCQIDTSSGVILSASASGGDGNYTYTWMDSSGAVVGSGQDFFATQQQAYTVEIKDGLYSSSCNGQYITVPVSQRTLPEIDAGADQIVCADDPYTELSWSLTNTSEAVWGGGQGSFTPDSSKQTVAYIPSASEIASGSATITLTSHLDGCPAVTDTLTIFYSPSADITLNDTTLACNGDQIAFTPQINGGSSPFTYQWSNGSTDSLIYTGVGTYCLTITDAMGCSSTACATIDQPSSLVATMNSTDITVDGGSDGTASVNAYGGTSPYTYLWSNGQTSSTITGLNYDIYSVTVTDTNGCQVIGSVVVTEPRCSDLQATASDYLLDCFGDENGESTLDVSGGYPPYSFQWNDAQSQTTLTATGLSAGIYMVTVSDTSNCHDVVSGVVIQQPDHLSNSIISTDVSVIGENDGSATTHPTGGNQGYSFQWSTGSTNQTINELYSGVYYLTITDSLGCYTIDSVRINEPGCENLKTFVYGEKISCNGGSDGGASVYTFGGTSPYNILWSTGDTTQTIENLTAGVYSVEITDSLNCSVFKAVVISEPTNISTGLAVNDISCYGKTDGSIDLTVGGGTYPYYFNWSNGSAAEDQINLGAGQYTVTVTDDQGCTHISSTQINEPLALTSTYLTQSVSCFGASDGAIQVNVEGGTSNYTFLWSDSVTTQNRDGLSEGLYWVKITDANGCDEGPINILMEQPGELTTNLTSTSDFNGYSVSCYGAKDGEILLNVNGGTAPYYNLWSSGDQNTDTLENISAGTYWVTISDENGCEKQDSITLNSPESLQLEMISSASRCKDSDDGEATVAVKGGVSNYSYQWSNGADTPTISSLGSGIYSVTVTDDNGCTANAESAVQESSSMETAITRNNISCYQQNDGEITVSAEGGIEPYHIVWNSGESSPSLDALSSGTYTVTITDGNECEEYHEIILEEPTPLSADIYSPQYSNGHHVSSYQGSDGAINLEVSGGTAPYTYQWSNGYDDKQLDNLPAGEYQVRITDANGCEVYKTLELTQPLNLDMPNAISPNGDGRNDFFVVKGIEAFPENEITIYNRWGNPVYSRRGYLNEWNGINENGNQLPAGTYFVVLAINDGEINMTGYVELVR